MLDVPSYYLELFFLLWSNWKTDSLIYVFQFQRLSRGTRPSNFEIQRLRIRLIC